MHALLASGWILVSLLQAQPDPAFLTVAAEKCDVAATRTLLDAGADPNQSFALAEALTRVKSAGCAEVAQLLLDHAASPTRLSNLAQLMSGVRQSAPPPLVRALEAAIERECQKRIAALAAARGPAREGPARMLAVCEAPGAKALLPLLSDPDLQLRRTAATMLGVIGPSAREAFETLEGLSGDPAMGAWAAVAASQVDPARGSRVAPALVHWTEAKDPSTVAMALEALWNAEQGDALPQAHLVALSHARDGAVRELALRLLVKRSSSATVEADATAALKHCPAGVARSCGGTDPCQLLADFDRDGRADLAVLVTARSVSRAVALVTAAGRCTLVPIDSSATRPTDWALGDGDGKGTRLTFGSPAGELGLSWRKGRPHWERPEERVGD